MKRVIPLLFSLTSFSGFFLTAEALASTMQADTATIAPSATPAEATSNTPPAAGTQTLPPENATGIPVKTSAAHKDGVTFEERDPTAQDADKAVVDASPLKDILPNPNLKQRPSLKDNAIGQAPQKETQEAPTLEQQLLDKLNQQQAGQKPTTPQAPQAKQVVPSRTLGATADEAEGLILRQRFSPSKSATQLKRELAYQLMLEQAVPLSPDQIIQLRKMLDLTEQAAATSPTTPPLPVSSSAMVSLEPGSLPPLIRLASGFVSSIVFVDSTGAPWPIASYSMGNPNEFNLQWDDVSNTLFIQSLQTYSHGNLAVRLADLNTPVMISLVSGQKAVDYRVDLQVKGRGPNATAPIVPSTVRNDRTLIDLLDGMPPKDSVKLQLTPDLGSAWTKGNTLYIRTQQTLLSPAWTNTVASADGTRVYEMPKTPFVLMSHQGNSISVELKGL